MQFASTYAARFTCTTHTKNKSSGVQLRTASEEFHGLKESLRKRDFTCGVLNVFFKTSANPHIRQNGGLLAVEVALHVLLILPTWSPCLSEPFSSSRLLLSKSFSPSMFSRGAPLSALKHIHMQWGCYLRLGWPGEGMWGGGGVLGFVRHEKVVSSSFDDAKRTQ